MAPNAARHGLTLGSVLALSEDPSAVEQRRSRRTAEWASRVGVASAGSSLLPEDVALGWPRMDLEVPFGKWEFGMENAAQGLPHPVPRLNLKWALCPAGRSSLLPRLRRCDQCFATLAAELDIESRQRRSSAGMRHLLDHVDRRMRLIGGAMGAVRRALIAPIAAPPRWDSILELAFRYLEYIGHTIQNFLKSTPSHLLETFGVFGLPPLSEALLDLVAEAKFVEGIPVAENGTGSTVQSGPIALKRRLSYLLKRPERGGPLVDRANQINGEERGLPPMKRQKHWE